MIDDISNYTMIYNVHAYKKDGSVHSGIEGFYEENITDFFIIQALFRYKLKRA